RCRTPALCRAVRLVARRRLVVLLPGRVRGLAVAGSGAAVGRTGRHAPSEGRAAAVAGTRNALLTAVRLDAIFALVGVCEPTRHGGAAGRRASARVVGAILSEWTRRAAARLADGPSLRRKEALQAARARARRIAGLPTRPRTGRTAARCVRNAV